VSALGLDERYKYMKTKSTPRKMCSTLLHGEECGVAALAPRLCLHACSLEFRHPATGEAVRVTSEAPF